MKSFKKFYVALTVTFCLSMPSIYAMEAVVKSEDCFVRTIDMKAGDPAFRIPLALAQQFRTLKNMFEDYRADQIGAQEFPLLITQATLSKILHLTDLYITKSPKTKEELLADACLPYSVIELAEIAHGLNYMHGLRPILIQVLCKLAEYVHAQKYTRGIAALCQQLDEILPHELQQILNEIFLLKFQNICSLTTIVRSFKAPGKSAPQVSHNYQSMIQDGIIYDLEAGTAKKTAKGFFGLPSPDGKYMVAQMGDGKTIVVDLETNCIRVIDSSRHFEFINNNILTIGKKEYNIETCLPLDNNSDKIKQALSKAKLPITAIDSIYKQLPQVSEVVKVATNGKWLALQYSDPVFVHDSFQLFIISNPQAIKEHWKSDRILGFVYDSRHLVIGHLATQMSKTPNGPKVFYDPSTITFSFFDPSTFKGSSVRFPLGGNPRNYGMEDYARANKVLGSAQSIVSAYVFLANLHTLVRIPLPLSKRLDEYDYSKTHTRFSKTDDDCIIIERKMLDGKYIITLCLLPLKRLQKCSVGQLVTLLNAVKKTSNMDEPYFKHLRENLPQDLKDLYFESQPKTHLETITLESGEQIECAVENDDVHELLTNDEATEQETK